MAYNPKIHHRRSIRLRNYNYAQNGVYFVTLCTQNRTCLFGEITDGIMQPNEAGGMISRWYRELDKKFSAINCDAFIVMPNHLHFILMIVRADLCVRPATSDTPNPDATHEQGGHIGPPLPVIVQWFKTMTTNEYIRGVHQLGWQPFTGKLWQRNYFERIIRDETELQQTREYIASNPFNWSTDSENPLYIR